MTPKNKLVWLAVGLAIAIVGAATQSYLAFGIGAFICWGVLQINAESGDKHFAGAQIVDAKKIVKKTRSDDDLQLQIGGVPIPRELENLNFAFAGSPGSGKSQAINGNLSTLRRRGDRVLMADAGGEALAGWMEPGDVILTPLDERATPWSPWAEFEGAWDAETVALSIIGEGGEGDSKEWNTYAANLLAAIFEVLWERGETTNGDLLYWSTAAAPQELAEMLAGQPVARFFAPGSERMLSSILGIIGSAMQPFRRLDPAAGREAFSLRHWCADPDAKHWVWFPYREDQSAALKPLLRGIFESAAVGLLSQPSQVGRRIFFVVDEFASLGRVSKMLDLSTKGRKYGACIFAGFQSISQIEMLYGQSGRNIIKNCLQSLLALNTADAATCKWLSEEFGETEILREKTSENEGVNTGSGIGQSSSSSGTSTTVEHVRQALILPSEFKGLETLTGVLQLRGYPAAVVRIAPAVPPHKNPPFVAAKPRPKVDPKKLAEAKAEAEKLVGFTVSAVVGGQNVTRTFATQEEADSWKSNPVEELAPPEI